MSNESNDPRYHLMVMKTFSMILWKTIVSKALIAIMYTCAAVMILVTIGCVVTGLIWLTPMLLQNVFNLDEVASALLTSVVTVVGIILCVVLIIYSITRTFNELKKTKNGDRYTDHFNFGPF